jgi:signal transduction histidine kinase
MTVIRVMDAASPEAATADGETVEVLIAAPGGEETSRFEDLLAAIEGGGFRCQHAATLKEALSLLGSGRFGIAFVGESLDAGTGISLIRAAGGRLCPTPMVLLSANASAETEQAGLSAGAVDIVEHRDLTASMLRRVIRYAQFNHDTTRRLIVEQQRYRDLAANASAASGEKTKFLAHMSHELRTPLNAILGFSDVIRHEMFGKIEGAAADRYIEYIRDIHESSQHLLSLINDLLDLSKIEAGRFEIAPVEIGLGNLVDEVKRMLQELARSKEIDLTVDLPSDGMEIYADRRLMVQAIVNVVANAIKFTPKGGSVSIAAQRQGQNAVIAISDTGCGIAPEDLAGVMQPFRQAGPLETRPEGGTGLGLPLARSIMELHQGGLEIESEPGRGTQVSIWLPCNVRLLSAAAG